MFAGFWKRFAAMIIDSLIVIFLILGAAVSLTFLPDLLPGDTVQKEAIAVMLGHLWWTIYFIYFAVMESSSLQGTFGKKMLGMSVVDVNGRQLSFLRALGRNAGKIISFCLFAVGFIIAAFTAKKQALHDIISSTLVVNNNFAPALAEAEAQTNSRKGTNILVAIAIILVVFVGVFFAGCLAAIAVPQYRVASEKIKIRQISDVLNQIHNIQYLRLQPAKTFEELHVSFGEADLKNPAKSDFQDYTLVIMPGGTAAINKPPAARAHVYRYAIYKNYQNGEFSCIAQHPDGKFLCTASGYPTIIDPAFFK